MKNVLDSLSLHDLRVLVVMSEVLHFGKAARICGISQPSLSQTVKKIEGVLGMQMYDRSPRDCRLTRQGEAAVEIASKILQSAEALGQIRDSGEGELTGRFHLGMIPTASGFVLGRLLPGLLGRCPRLEVMLTEGTTDELKLLVAERKVDAAIVSLPLTGRSFATEVLAYEQLWLAVGVNDPLAEREEIRVTELPENRMLLLEKAHCLRQQALDLCPGNEEEGHALHLATLLQLVKIGVGVTILPESAWAMVGEPGGVRLVRIVDPIPTRAVAMLGLRSRWSSGMIRGVRERAKDCLLGA